MSSNDRSSLWTSRNKREFGHSFNMRNSHLSMYTQKQTQHRCLTSCLIRSLVRHLEAMVLQLHEYLIRCLSDIHTSPHQKKRPCIMVQTLDSHLTCNSQRHLQFTPDTSSPHLTHAVHTQHMQFTPNTCSSHPTHAVHI